MEQRGAEGTEFVLDNRKLIIVFLLLVLMCGAFFVIGFMEGKRQSVQFAADRSPSATEAGSGQVSSPDNTRPAETKSAAPPVEGKSVRDQLDWYKNVQGGSSDPLKSAESVKPAPAVVYPGVKKPPTTAPKTAKPESPTPRSMVPAANLSYSVQVGAFRQRREAESKADALKAKGFTCTIEAPQAADQLFQVKVGRFKSRAEAVAMQVRLRKAGFNDCFIKTN